MWLGLTNFMFVFGILASFIDLKADLEGPSSLRDLLLDQSNSPIPNKNTKLVNS